MQDGTAWRLGIEGLSTRDLTERVHSKRGKEQSAGKTHSPIILTLLADVKIDDAFLLLLLLLPSDRVFFSFFRLAWSR